MGIGVIDLGVMPYADAYGRQVAEQERVIRAREEAGGSADAGVILLVEHPPVVTLSRRPGAEKHIVASRDVFEAMGVDIQETDRGGDVTYHGPGQLVGYPILDLNTLDLGLHAYMRMLEEAVIRTCASFGVRTMRDPGATGVWTQRRGVDGDFVPGAKIAAMGVRVRRWTSMHGLALNVRPRMEHFGLIVACGLHGREVTSLERELGEMCPTMDAVKARLASELTGLVEETFREAQRRRAHAVAASSETRTN